MIGRVFGNARYFLISALFLGSLFDDAVGQPKITVFLDENYGGTSTALTETVFDLGDGATPLFDNAISSVKVEGAIWRLYNYKDLDGCCGSVVLLPGDYPTAASMGISDNSVSSIYLEGHPKIVLHDQINYGGNSFTLTVADPNLKDAGFDNKASSVEVFGGTWKLCKKKLFKGACNILGPGLYSDPASMGITDNSVSSVQLLNSI